MKRIVALFTCSLLLLCLLVTEARVPAGELRTTPQAPPAVPQSAPAESAFTLPATLWPDESVELHAKASGYVSEITVDIGSRVRKGDLLIRLDAPEMSDDIHHAEARVAAYQARAAAARAQEAQSALKIEAAMAENRRAQVELDLSRLTHRRKAELLKETAIPQQEFDVADNELRTAEAKLAIAQAQVESAKGEKLAAQANVTAAEAEVSVAQADLARLKTLLEYTRIRAPFDGVVTARTVDHGAFVRSAVQGASAGLLTLQKVDRVRLVIDVPETQASLVRAGTPVTVRLRALKDEPLVATVTRTAGSLRTGTRTLRAEIDLDNRNGHLMPGMFGRVTLTASSEVNVPGA